LSVEGKVGGGDDVLAEMTYKIPSEERGTGGGNKGKTPQRYENESRETDFEMLSSDDNNSPTVVD
jgi:hypothetical protein